MLRSLYLSLFILVLFSVFGSATASSSKELRQQQKVAQQERYAQKKERTANFNSAKKSFREYVKDIKKEYREQVAEFRVDFDLKRVELQADHEANVAEAAAENEKKTLNLFVNPDLKFDEATLERLQKEAKAYSDDLFALKKQSAEQIQLEQVAFEKRKNEIFTERDQNALDKAAELGMTKNFAPIIASPIGGSLTRSEERWNEQEKKGVIKLKQKNKKTVSEFKYGKKLRDWKLQKMKEDFKLNWEEKFELHELDSQSLFLNTLMMQAFRGEQIDQQELIDKASEINKQKKLINIKYKKYRDKNRIIRNKERKGIING